MYKRLVIIKFSSTGSCWDQLGPDMGKINIFLSSVAVFPEESGGLCLL